MAVVAEVVVGAVRGRPGGAGHRGRGRGRGSVAQVRRRPWASASSRHPALTSSGVRVRVTVCTVCTVGLWDCGTVLLWEGSRAGLESHGRMDVVAVVCVVLVVFVVVVFVLMVFYL